MNNHIAYLVYLAEGLQHEISYQNLFITSSKSVADKYADRYNKIIESHYEIADRFNNQSIESFMQWEILFDKPTCLVREVEVR